MKSKLKYWDILCERHTQTVFRKKIDATHISEKKLTEFIRTILAKYALSDDEILEQCLSLPFKKKTNYINIQRRNNNLGDPLEISFSAQLADISIIVQLTS